MAAVRSLVGISRRGTYRPKLVLFGDAMCQPDWSQSLAAVEGCDCLLQVGCSGQVMPAAMLSLMAMGNGAAVIHVDPEESPADVWLPGKAGEALPRLVAAAFDDPEALEGIE